SPRRSSHMPTGKRASMREGPLAALFRRTTEDQAEDLPAADASVPSGSERAPDTAAAPAPPPEPVEAPRIPSPQERLRQAFSSDLPESLLERPPPPPVRPRAEPAERYAEAFPRPGSVGSPVIRVVGVGGAGVNAV